MQGSTENDEDSVMENDENSGTGDEKSEGELDQTIKSLEEIADYSDRYALHQLEDGSFAI